MGLFSFAKSAGRKLGLFGGDAPKDAVTLAQEAVQRAQSAVEDAQRVALANQATGLDIRAAIQSYGLEIADLEVKCSGDTVTLTGTAPSQEVAEKAVLIAGNTEGIATVQDDMSVEAPAPPAIHHTVAKGDSLSKIALAQYGNMHLYNVIFEANTPMLRHPDEIYPGQVLRIPRVAHSTHTVEAGDTLGKIAKHYYGDAKRYTDIFEANKGRLASPDAIEVGQELVIPLSGPAVDPAANA